MADPNAKRVTAGGDANRPNSIIDDDATSFIMKATRIHKNSKTLTAPNVTVFDGEPAYILITKDTAYIADYNEPNATGLFAMFAKPVPVVKTIKSGTDLKVLPKLLDDGQNILLDVDFNYTNVDIVSVGNYKQKRKYSRQVPIAETIGVDTRVAVPNGGTLVIGGQEITIKDESGKKQTQTLLVLIKAVVIDNPEAQ